MGGTSFAFDLHAPRFFDEVEFGIDLDFIQRYCKRFINHALLQIQDMKSGSLDTTLDLNDLLSRLMDDLWASELSISNFSPTNSKCLSQPFPKLSTHARNMSSNV
ncbi:hypothetical protein Tco_1250806 [Tanacetum coccineum]